MDHETSPFQVNLAYQVPKEKPAEYIGKAALERQRDAIEAGNIPSASRWSGSRWMACQ